MVRLDSDGKYTSPRFGALAQRVDPPVEVDAAGPVAVVFGRGDEQLRHVGHAAQRRHADFGAVRVDGHLAPAEDVQAFFVGDGLDAFARAGAGDRILRQEADARGEGVGAVRRRRRKLEVDDLAKQFDGQLEQDACTVTAVGFGARGAAVFEVFQRDEPVGDDGVRAAALDVGDHGDATGVRLVLGVVQALSVGQCRKQHWTAPPQSGKSCPGLHRPELSSVSAQLPRLPAREAVGTSGNPGRFRTTVQVIAATTMTTIAGMGINCCPRRQRTRSQASQHGQADEEEDVVDDGGGEVAVQQVVGHPQARRMPGSSSPSAP